MARYRRGHDIKMYCLNSKRGILQLAEIRFLQRIEGVVRDQFIPYPGTLHVTVIGLISLVHRKGRVKDKDVGRGAGVFSRPLTESLFLRQKIFSKSSADAIERKPFKTGSVRHKLHK